MTNDDAAGVTAYQSGPPAAAKAPGVRPWVLVVSILATAVVFGSCGVGIGAAGSDGSAVAAQPVVTMTATATVTETATADLAPAASAAPLEPTSSASSTAPPPVQAPSTDPTVAVGEVVTDDEVSYVVTGVDCSVATIDNVPADGQFCVLSFEVTNGKSRSHEFDPGDVEAYLGSTVVQPDEMASAALLSSASVGIEPGQSVALSVAFQVPDSTGMTSVRFTTDVVSVDGAVVLVS